MNTLQVTNAQAAKLIQMVGDVVSDSRDWHESRVEPWQNSHSEKDILALYACMHLQVPGGWAITDPTCAGQELFDLIVTSVEADLIATS
jgi:hypothetical protein